MTNPRGKYFDVKDHCRKGLQQHLDRATSLIPKIGHPNMLDAGCGSGVPTMFMMEKFGGDMTAIDPDPNSINYLREKAKKANLENRLKIINCSLFDLKEGSSQFDLIIAEGLLNIVGFQQGFLHLVSLIKSKGFIIIHDEYQEQMKKNKFIESNDCRVIDSFELHEQIWWNDYYQCLEISIHSDKNDVKQFESELLEIEAFKKDSSEFKSVYYVIKRN